MGSISGEAKKRYSDRISEYQKKIDELAALENKVLQMIQKDPRGIEYKKIRLAEENLTAISYYILMNELSVHLLDIKNEPVLNNARKLLYKVLIYLEQVVTDHIDLPFSEYLEKLDKIQGLTPKQRLHIVKKLGFSINRLEDIYGDNSKWKWSFADIWARYATVAKNMLNLRTLAQDYDPQSPHYPVIYEHVELVINKIMYAAEQMRLKYELSTHSANDYKVAIRLLEGLRLLYMVLGKNEEASETKRRAEVWLQKLEDDMKQKKGKK